jgi:hypothetical protein
MKRWRKNFCRDRMRAEVGEGGGALTPGDATSFWTKANLLKGYAETLRGAAYTFQASDEEG